MIVVGKICHLVADRGFAFIKRDDGGADVFLHFRKIVSGEPMIGARAEFEVGPDRNGKMQALNVVIDG